MKTILVLLAIQLLVLVSSCENPTSMITPKFGEYEVHFKKFGGWINTSILDLSKTGAAKAEIVSQGNLEILDSNHVILSVDEREKIDNLFGSFLSYESFYQPDEYMTDQNYYTVVLTYKDIPDTVTVYHLEEVTIPESLRILLVELESLHNRIIENLVGVVIIEILLIE